EPVTEPNTVTSPDSTQTEIKTNETPGNSGNPGSESTAPVADPASESTELLQNYRTGGGYELRNAEGRGKRGGPGDPTDRSEEAVEAGLSWLAAHQESDGGWSFGLGECGRRRLCSKPGPHTSRTAATALALLPFFGAGYTHLDGQYKKVVERGLLFMLDSKNCVEMSVGANLQQGEYGFYSQGLATIALCEAYGMTRGKAKDKRGRDFEEKLRETAQNAIRYIEYGQNTREPFRGGWRYKAGEMPGDLSVTGWQAIALKSALLAGLEVKSTTLINLENFLVTTQYDNGVRFNYLPVNYIDREGKQREGKFPNSKYTCTAIGHLLNMYLGKKPGNKPLDAGISLLDEWGPLKSETREMTSQKNCNLYYTYYGTLAVHHYGGSAWNRWYSEARDFLVQTQSMRGHETGSWYYSDPYCDAGGRLLNTALAIMILEVPYRYMPLYE
ncbi:MAG: prenyltransferase/squalene oxidase repeat-containing protein, partial [Thermoguttaceae bacterium]